MIKFNVHRRISYQLPFETLRAQEKTGEKRWAREGWSKVAKSYFMLELESLTRGQPKESSIGDRKRQRK